MHAVGVSVPAQRQSLTSQHQMRGTVGSERSRGSYRLLIASALWCLMTSLAGACSSASSQGDSGEGGAGRGGGGATGTGGTSSIANGGASGSAGAGGGVGPNSTGGSGGVSAAGTGGSTGLGGAAPGGGTGGGRVGGGGAGPTGGTGGVGGLGGSGGLGVGGLGGKGLGGNGSGGSGGKPAQTTLPALTIHLAGDSTMSDYPASTIQEGWGQELGQYFIAKVTIDNQAQPGANIDTFYSGRWKTLIANVKAGDYVMAAFGINDSGTTHGPVAPDAFQTQMGVMADEVAAKKATFIPTTSSPLQVWENGKETNARLQPYCDATIAVGASKGLLVDDLNARGVAYYNLIGQTAAAALTFNGDKAHFDKQGATEMALLASQELARINSPLAAYLK